MEINLSLLKFHSFKFKKNIHNEWNIGINKNIKNESDFKNIVFNDLLVRKLKHIKQFINFNKLLIDLRNERSFHPIKDKPKNLLMDVIKNCHPKLYLEIEQKFLENKSKDEISIFQTTIDKRSRLIIIHEENIIYPILLDLNHCFYSVEINYDNNYGKKSNPWDFKEEQEKLKGSIYKSI